MRTITKRLTVANDGFCNFKLSAHERVMIKVNKYIVKMENLGWKLDATFCGNAFNKYEAIVELSK